jgi:TadE-like protein
MSHRPRSTGQALVEFALVVPIFLVLLLGIFDFGRVVWASNSLASAAREGARFAIVHGGSPMDPCPVGPLSPQYGPLPSSWPADCLYPATTLPFSSDLVSAYQASKQAIRNAALSAALAGGTSIAVTVCYGVGCSGDTDSTTADGSNAPDGNNARGNPVTVRVSSQLPLAVPGLLGFSTFSVSGSSTMLVNH